MVGVFHALRVYAFNLERQSAQRLAEIDLSSVASKPFWSPDSRYIGYSAGGKLRRFDLERGASQMICDMPGYRLRGGTWSEHGVILFGVDDRETPGLYRVSAEGGEPERLSVSIDQQGKGIRDFWPEFLPGGQEYVFWRRRENMVHLASLGGNDSTGLTKSDSGAIFAEPGSLVYILEGSLLTQRLDAEERSLLGAPFPILEGIDPNPQGRTPASVSSDRVLIVADRRTLRQLQWLDRSGNVVAALGEPRRYFTSNAGNVARINPDGLSILVPLRLTSDRSWALWIVDGLRGGATPVDPLLSSYHGIWSPDGSDVVYADNRPSGLFRSRLGVSEREFLAEGSYPTDWSPDGEWLLYRDGMDLKLLPMRAEGEPIAFAASEFAELMGRFSPNGRWVAYVSDESGANEVYLRELIPDGESLKVGPSVVVSSGGGVSPVWGQDESELFYCSSDDKLVAIALTLSDAVEIGEAVELFDLSLPRFDTRDGRRFLVPARVEGYTAPLRMIVNWPALLGD